MNSEQTFDVWKRSQIMSKRLIATSTIKQLNQSINSGLPIDQHIKNAQQYFETDEIKLILEETFKRQ